MGARLVRDRALENWVVPGAERQVRPVTNKAEHLQLLRQKLLEECGEVIFAWRHEELTREIGDVLSVLQSLAERVGISWGEVLQLQHERDLKGGSFVRGLVWETSR
jgi:predicted house-cleaning noncanonical NTP pyrophosphatase (MazG superfamily)